ncbi:hypothetical protein Pla108_29020 [Botrimarina colliarenosi]|uniref:Uncharacterized protein n=1 Tax=Botrimarina colliarenosi TaxID=2528001 RepID=A0A5C6A940_9BACT|nr:hypothetical protein [Botrimarina colliarenosi]TWT95825.1 hypothetical protein Pla108_29020 [Botrimarina colliarenosi]
MRPVSRPRLRLLRPQAWLLGLLAALTLSSSTGCLIPMYSADPARRAQQLLYTSEDLRTFLDEWERVWFLDSPSHMKPYRTSGLVL